MAEKQVPLNEEHHPKIGTQSVDQDYHGYKDVLQMASTPQAKLDKNLFNLPQEYQIQHLEDEHSFHLPGNAFGRGQGSFPGQRSQVRLNGLQGDDVQTTFLNNSGTSKTYYREQQNSTNIPQKPPKEKKSISTKTFAHGLMDVSLLTTHATQLRTVISNKEHEFYNMLIWMIGISIAMQVLSGVLLLTSDFYKTQDKVTDRRNQKKRKVLSFISLCIVALNTPLKILISAFYISHDQLSQTNNIPKFSSASYHSYNHTEL